MKELTMEQTKKLMQAKLARYHQELDTLEVGFNKAKEMAEDAIFEGDMEKAEKYKAKMVEFYDRLVDVDDNLNRFATIYNTIFGSPVRV